MSNARDILLTAAAPVIWGSTYLVTTEYLPEGVPLIAATARALIAGVALFFFSRRLPGGSWWLKSIVLGFLNFTVFWAMLFVTAYRLPGGVAATIGSVQPLLVLFLSVWLIGGQVTGKALTAAVMGVVGVGLMVLSASASLDGVGVAAGLIGILSMSIGTVLTKRWQPPASALALTSWQLLWGGVLLLPLAMAFEAWPVQIDLGAFLGIAYLAIPGAALTAFLWFRGIGKLGPSAASLLGFLSPLTAMLLGWMILGQALTLWQICGAVMVLASVTVGPRQREHS